MVKFRLLLSIALVIFSTLGAAATQESVGGDFQLIDHNGKEFNLNQLRGKAVLIFFGYTHCPGICPTELAKLSAMLNSLQELNDSVQVLFITVDPKRDTAEHLKTYVQFFSKDLIGLTGSIEQIESVKEQYRVTATQFKQRDSVSEYTVDHSVNYYLIDPTGQLNTIVPYGFPMQHIQKVLEGIIANS